MKKSKWLYNWILNSLKMNIKIAKKSLGYIVWYKPRDLVIYTIVYSLDIDFCALSNKLSFLFVNIKIPFFYNYFIIIL